MAVYTDVLCPFCGCICDDIVVEVGEDGKITKVRGACAIGRSKIMGHDRMESPAIREDGELRDCSYDEAIKRAAEILADARRPLLYGWSSTVCETDRVGVELAVEIGAIIDNTASVCHGPSILAIQDVGLPSCTLGQIRNRADIVIYWGSNPVFAHPNHMKRYSYLSKGRFTPGGKKDRKMVVVDVRETKSAKLADLFVKVRPGGDFLVFSALRAILQGHEDVVPDEVAGVEKKDLLSLAEMIKNANFIITFFGMGVTHSGARHNNIANAIEFTRAAHLHTKATIMPMRGHYNVNGFNQVCTWLLGYPFSIDLSQGYPWYNPGETGAVDVLVHGECDAALIISSDPASHFPADAVRHLARIPVIQIDPYPNPTTEFADVVIPSAICGVEAEGSVYRMDSVPLRVRKIVDSKFMADEEIIRRILEEVRAIKEKEGE